jgi:carnosine N-methyltransferase
MLLASYFILNKYGIILGSNLATDHSTASTRTDEIRKHKLYPYVHTFSNAPTREAMLHPVYIPDVLPSALPSGSNFSLVAGECMSFLMRYLACIQPSGDFEEIYGVNTDPREPHSGQWDSVVTCFFIDTVRTPIYIPDSLYS